MSETEFESITSILREQGVEFESIEHEAVRTSEEAAKVRGQELKVGVKALVMKFKRNGKDFFCVMDIPADRKLDFKKAKQVLQAQEVKFASEQEVIEQTGCEPGGVPPFGYSKKLAFLVDQKIFEQENLEFNAGLKTKSIRIESAGLKKVFDSLGVAYFDLTVS